MSLVDCLFCLMLFSSLLSIYIKQEEGISIPAADYYSNG